MAFPQFTSCDCRPEFDTMAIEHSWSLVANPWGRRRRSADPASRVTTRSRGAGRCLAYERLEHRRLLAGDVQVRFEFTDLAQSPLTELQAGQDFLLRAYVQDMRTSPPPQGLFRAFLDVRFDPSVATPTGAITPGPEYAAIQDGGSIATPGLLDEAGGTDSDSLSPLPANSELLLFSVPFQASGGGTFELTLEQATKATSRFNEPLAIPVSEYMVVNGAIEVAAPAIRLSRTSGLVTDETGATDAFEISLATQPTANVTIPLRSSDTTEGTVMPASVTFTPANWNVPQTVTVAGVNDFVADGNVPYQIITDPATSTDLNYNGVNAADVAVTNQDDADAAGVNVQPATGQTTEAGGTAQFQIRLTSQPTANVRINLSSSDATEGTVAPAFVEFTTSNWNTPQTVTVTGQDDDVADGTMSYSVITSAAISTDPQYSGRAVPDAAMTNVDNDSPGVIVEPTTGTTTEAGGTAQFQIRLTSEPTADVTITLASDDATEGIVAPTSVTFTSGNWDQPRTITVTGQNDDIDDGNVAYSIVTSAAMSSDPNYSGRAVPDVSLTNMDDADAVGFVVQPLTGQTTEANNGTAMFTMALTSQPLADVRIDLSSNDTSEGIVAPTSLTFTSANWNQPQTVTVTGQDDDVDDGNIAYAIVTAPAVSLDPAYNGRNPADVSMTNVDNDAVGISVAPLAGQTSEGGGMVFVSVFLNTQPTADVTIGVSSSDETEGTASVSQLVFTPSNWKVPQQVVVTGQDDDVDDGDVAYMLVTAPAASADPIYNNRNAADVALTNVDNDGAGILVEIAGSLETTETGGTAQFGIRLASQPTSDVTIPLSSDNMAEGTVAPANVTFTSANWAETQTVTVTGVDDDVDDGDVAYKIITNQAQSLDAKYAGLDADDPAITNRDDDEAALILSAAGPLVTSEGGGTAEFTVELATEPLAPVTVTVGTTKADEATANPQMLTFTAANWDVPQTVTLAGVDDDAVDGDVPYAVTVEAASAGADYQGLFSDELTAVNEDDDTPGLTVTPVAGLETSEDGDFVEIDYQLATQPASDVVIAVASSDTTEGTVAPASLTFTAANWNVPQRVRVTGADDGAVDGAVAYDVTASVTASTDPGYAALPPRVLALTNRDNDTPGVTIAAVAGTATTESGGAVRVSVVLDAQPSADVTVQLIPSDATEAQVASAPLVFTPSNWDVPQEASVVGVADSVVDGNVPYDVVAAAASSDLNYEGLASDPLFLTNNDDDSASITITPVTDALVEGNSPPGAFFEYVVELTGAVEGGFSLPFSVSDATATASSGDYVDADGTLAFQGVDGEQQTIRVQVGPDDVVESDETLLVALGAVTGLDSGAAARISVESTPQTATIFDDDSVQIAFTEPTQAEGTGSGATAFSFGVSLSNPVQDGLRIRYKTVDGSATTADGDYAAASGTIDVFGAVGENANIVVNINRDAVVERDETFSVEIEEILFVDAALNDMFDIPLAMLTGTILNDDMATIGFVNASSLAIEAAGRHTVPVRLTVTGGGTLSEAATVNVAVLAGGTAVAPDDYALATTSITFAAGSADGAMEIVNVDVVDDDVMEDAETLRLGLTLIGDGIGGNVQQGAVVQHDVQISEDPLTGSIIARAWYDANRNGMQDGGEFGIPGVEIMLTGVDRGGRSVERTATTDADGVVRFESLPSGEYALVETQPAALVDGAEQLGTVAGGSAGVAGDDQFTQINLDFGGQAAGYAFGEVGLTAAPFSRRMFFASSPSLQDVIGDIVAGPGQNSHLNGSAPQQESTAPRQAAPTAAALTAEASVDLTDEVADLALLASEELRAEAIAAELAQSLG